MAHCNIERTENGIKVFVEGTQEPSKLFERLKSIVDSEPEFVSARPTFFAVIADKLHTSAEVAVEIYKSIMKNPAVRSFMAGSTHIDSNGEPVLSLKNGNYVVTGTDNRTKVVIPKGIPTEKTEEPKPSLYTKMIVDSLVKRFNIRVKYTAVGDFKGRFVVEGSDRYVELNLSKMTSDTPFHEFGHPLVLALKQAHPAIYDKLIKQYGDEESIVEALGKEAKSSYLFRQITHFLRSVLAKVFPKIANNYSLESLMINSTIKDLSDVLINSSKLEIPQFDEDMVLYQKDTEAVKNILNSQKVNDTDYVALFNKLSSELEEKPDDQEHYYKNGSPIGRLTQWVHSTFSRAVLTPTEQVDRIFKSQNKNTLTDKIYLENGKLHYNYEEAIVYFEAVKKLISERGRLKHSYMELLMEKDPRKAKALEEDIWRRAKAWEAIATSPAILFAKPTLDDTDVIDNWAEFKYINRNIDDILRMAGITKRVGKRSMANINPDQEDTVMNEVKLYSNILDLGTRADTLVIHKDNSVSIVDWKTGDITSDFDWNRVMAYADELGIKDNKLTRAKLEVVLRALTIKEHAPETVFRNLKIVRLNSAGFATYEADVHDMLALLGKYFQATDKTKYELLKSKGLLNPADYVGTSQNVSSKITEMKLAGAKTREDMIQYAMRKIRGLGYKKSVATLKHAKEYGTSKELKEWGEIVLDLIKDPGAQLNADTFDSSTFMSYIKNLSDVSNPVVQSYNKTLIEAQTQVEDTLSGINSRFDAHLKALIVDRQQATSAWRAPMPLVNVLKVIAAVGTFTNPLLTVGVIATGEILKKLDMSNDDLYGWMIREENGSEYLNTSNQWFNKRTEKVEEMTDAMRNFRDFYVSEMNRVWKESMSIEMDANLGLWNEETIPKYAMYNLAEDLPSGFFPRIPLNSGDSDIKLSDEPLSNYAMLLKEKVQRWMRSNFTEYSDSDYNDYGFDTGLIPLKYYSHPGDSRGIADRKENDHRTYSHDLGLAFKLFTSNLVKKQYMDDAFVLGMATVNILKFKKTNKANPDLDNLIRFLEKSVLMQTIEEYDKDKLLTKPFTIKLGKAGAALFGLDEGTTITISGYKLAKLLTKGISFVVMSFKPILFAANIALIQGVNFTRALSGSVATRLGNVPPEYANATLSGYFSTIKDYGKYVYDGLSGNLDNNKAWIIAKRIGWLADNYDFETKSDKLIDYRHLLSMRSIGFMFSKVSETEGSIYHLISLLKSTKWKYDDGTVRSFWDMYDEQGNYKESLGVRARIDEGNGFTRELRGMDYREIKNLKRINERLQGSYRKEEKIALEYTLVGQMALQFKKYLPTYLKNNLQSPYRDITQGFYKRKENEDLYTWESRLAWGRWRLILSMMGSPTKFNSLSPEYKQEAMHVISTMLFSFGVGLATDDIFAKDSYLDKRMEFLSQSLSQGLFPTDMAHDLSKSNIIAFTKADNLLNNGWDLLFNGLIMGERTKNGDMPGWNNIKHDLPFIGAWDQITRATDTSLGTIR